MISAEEARTHAPEVHARWAAVTPGSVLRADVLWDLALADPESDRDGGTALFHLAHPDGYAAYRMHHDRNTLVVRTCSRSPRRPTPHCGGSCSPTTS
jgi:predicted acetyltransferase